MTEWVGIPFVDGGRTAEAVDCYGIVRLYLLEEFGIELPLYGETPVADVVSINGLLAQTIADGTWRSVQRHEAKKGDVVLMWSFERIDGRPVRTLRHLGVLTTSRSMLHVELNTDSVVVALSHPLVRERLESFWRHKDL